MKNLVLYLNPLYPKQDHNSNLVLKLAPYLDCNAHIISMNTANSNKNLPAQLNGIPVHFIKRHRLLDGLLFHFLKLVRGPEKADHLMCKTKTRVQSLPFRLRHKQHAVLSTYHMPYPPMVTAQMGRNTKKALYLMDPTDAMWKPGTTCADDNPWFLSVLKRHDVVFTTRFVREAMLSRGYGDYAKNIVEVSFPMITDFPYKPLTAGNEKITLLFAGRIYAGIRSPEYFFRLLSRLDDRFRVVFIGPDSDTIQAHIPSDSAVEIITKPAVPYDEILQEMANADILINIGNSIPVHLPSKTLEYINTGKPFVNFYKFDQCPTLHYTNKYPLCLNLNEQDDDIASAAQKFADFCINARGKQLDRAFVEQTFYESTPKAIAQTISQTLFQ